MLRDNCVRPDGSRSLVVDVGANFGYFTVYAASMGCRWVGGVPASTLDAPCGCPYLTQLPAPTQP